MSKKPLRVLLFTDNHTQNAGGCENQFFALKTALGKRPDIEVISMGFGPKAVHTQDEIILEDSRSNILRQWWNMFCHPGRYRQIQNILRQIRPDVIHLHNIRRHTPAVLKAIRNWPVIQTVHDFAPVCPSMTCVHYNNQHIEPCPSGMRLRCLHEHRGQYPLFAYPGILFSFWRMRRGLRRSVNHFIAPSPSLQNYLLKNDFQPASLVLPFPDQGTPQTAKMTTQDPHTFLYVGKLSKFKGAKLLVREFAHALKSHPLLILNMAGDGPLRKKLQTWTEQNGLSHQIRLLGQVHDRKQLDGLYEEALCVIFPAIGMESFGLVMTEAMSHSRPVIGAHYGTPAWLIDPKNLKNGLLFDPAHQGDLAERICFFADHPDLAHQYGQNAKESLSRLESPETCVEKIINLYRQVITPL